MYAAKVVLWSIRSSLFHLIIFSAYLVLRRQTYCIGHSSSMGLSVFSASDDPIRERVDDGSVGVIDISRFRCSGLSG
jgi:hypothetical protein